MKAFLIGLLFLFSIGLLSFIIILLVPLLAALNFILYIALFTAISILPVWLLGKFLIWAWEAIRK